MSRISEFPSSQSASDATSDWRFDEQAHDHSVKVLLGLGGVALALSVAILALPLARLAASVGGTQRAVSAIDLGFLAPSGPAHFASATAPAVTTLVKAYAPDAGQDAMMGLGGGLTQSVPAAPAVSYRRLTPAQAMALNISIPVSSLPNPAAQPFQIPASDAVNRAAAVNCLTQAVYYEAASESDDGEAAVAQVVLNRMRHPLFPKSVCGVVYQGSTLPTGCQFTFTCDGSLNRRPSIDGWKRAQRIAERALDGYVMKAVGEATHYHTQWVVPYWQPTVTKLTQIGAHIFYRWSGGMGAPSAFRGQYAGFEAAPMMAGAPTPVTPSTIQVAVAAVTAAKPVVMVSQFPAAPAAASAKIGAAPATPAPGAQQQALVAKIEAPKLAPEVAAAIKAPAPVTSYFGNPRRNGNGIGW